MTHHKHKQMVALKFAPFGSFLLLIGVCKLWWLDRNPSLA